MLTAAENNSLKLNINTFNSKEFLNELISGYKNHAIAKNKHILLDADSENIEIKSDRSVIRRIMINILNNALEATLEGGTITIYSSVKDDKIKFSVHNPGFVPREAQLQIFQRSFSTKGKGRGIGTYSIILLTSLLNGDVSFTSSKAKGTKFTVSCPINSTL